MKKIVKIILIALFLLIIAVIAVLFLYPKISLKLRDGKWTKEDGFYVYYKNGEKLVDQEITSGGKYYLSDKNGYRLENYTVTDKKGNIVSFYGPDGAQIRDGFAEIKGIEYYFDNNGKLGKNQWAYDRYVDKNGKITKKKWIDGFYLDENGNKAKNTWIKNKYVGTDGKVLKSTTTPDGFEVDKYGNKIVPLLEQISANEYAFGTEITFGNFEQDGDNTNGPEPIEWMLITHTKDKAYLLSKKVLYNCKYQEEDEAVLGRVSFNNSFIKHWLTNNFYESSFTDDEKNIYQILKMDMYSYRQ